MSVMLFSQESKLCSRKNSSESQNTKSKKMNNTSCNKARTSLLLLTNTEIVCKRRNLSTKINSKYLYELENEFSEEYFIHLGEETFSSFQGRQIISSQKKIE